MANDRRTPAPVEQLTVDGLAVIRRANADINPNDPLVVLVHGAMDRAASFGRVMRRLPDFEVVAYDRRGYAGSRQLRAQPQQQPDDGSGPSEVWHVEHTHRPLAQGAISCHADDLLSVIKFATLNSPLARSRTRVVVVGHSLGGLVALRAASSEYQSKVSPAYQIQAVGAYESPAPWLDNSFEKVGGGAVEMARRTNNSDAAEFFYRSMIGEATFARLRQIDKTARRDEGDALIAELVSLRDPLQSFDLRSVEMPVIVASGTDTPESMRHNADLMEGAVLQPLRVEVKGAAHGAHLSRPDGFAGFVRICIEQANRQDRKPVSVTPTQSSSVEGKAAHG